MALYHLLYATFNLKIKPAYVEINRKQSCPVSSVILKNCSPSSVHMTVKISKLANQKTVINSK